MGKANRQRRAAKVRKRQAAKASPRPPRSGPDPSRHGPRDRRSAADDPLFTPGDRFILAVAAEQSGDFARAAEFVAVLAGEPPARVGREVLARIENHVGALWEVGWEPSDLDRLVARRLGRTELRLVRWAIASQAQTLRDPWQTRRTSVDGCA